MGNRVLPGTVRLNGVTLSAASAAAMRRRPIPTWINPTLATLTHHFFWNSRWAYEEKLDGERLLACKTSTSVTIYSRSRQVLNGTYPEIRKSLASIPGQWWLDGEVAARSKRGATSFKLLQQRLQIKDAEQARRSTVAVCFYVFDIMYLQGYDVRDLPYRDRRRLVARLVKPSLVLQPVRTVAPVRRSFTEACQNGWEGLMVKNLDSTYSSKRTRDWLKFKAVSRQELVVIGYTDPRRSRAYFGALLLGYFDRGHHLHYAGKVGTGFSDATLQQIYSLMAPRQVAKRSVLGHVPLKGVHWLWPPLVAEIGFTEWTKDNRLRHPRFLGLRTDKTPQDVVKE